MRTFFILAASALLLAAVIVELSSRLWPGSGVALLALASLALISQGYLSLRFAAPAAAGASSSARNARSARSAKREPTRASAAKSQPSSPAGSSAGSSADRESGTVKWFNRTKGFGFIVRESGEEIFVHQRSIRVENGSDGRRRPSLKDGQNVTFTVANREKGLQAEDVVPG